MPTLDIFNNDAFSVIALTDAINKIPFAPQRISNMNLFEEEGIYTTSVGIEEYSGSLSLIPNKPRGGPATQNFHNKRKIRSLNVPHLPLEDTVLADEIQNVRAFGAESDLQSVQGVVDMRLAEMSRKHDTTVEWGRLGALKGMILDSDGTTVIHNLFAEFGVTQQVVDFQLGTATSDILGATEQVAYNIEDELGQATFEDIYILAGRTFFERFVTHPTVRAAYQFFQSTGQVVNPLRDDLRYKGFPFGSVIIEQYRARLGGVPFIADNEAYAFPIGVPGLFKTYYAPADFMETVNTKGLPRYAKQAPMNNLNQGQLIHTQSNPLSLCLRPGTLIKCVTSN